MSVDNNPTIFTGVAEPDARQFDAWSHQPLLVSIEQGGIDWPSSCRSGHCRTCLGQLQSGKVRYDETFTGLSPEELALGYVLPCVAYPCTDVVVQQGL